MASNNESKKRFTVEAIVRSIRKGKTWEEVAVEFGFDSAEKIREFTKEKSNHYIFREIDKKAKKK